MNRDSSSIQPGAGHLRQRTVLVILCLLLSGSITGILLGLPALAASREPNCQGHGCDGTDPYTSGCAGTSFATWGLLQRVPLRAARPQRPVVGWLQLWWSQTCETNWARVIDLIPQQNFYVTLGVQDYSTTCRDRKAENTSCLSDIISFIPHLSSFYTGQLFLPTSPAQTTAFMSTGHSLASAPSLYAIAEIHQ